MIIILSEAVENIIKKRTNVTKNRKVASHATGTTSKGKKELQ